MARRKGLFLSDVIIGLAIVAVLTVSLMAALGRHRQASRKLADLREATRSAEAVLTDLQAGRASPASDLAFTVAAISPPTGDAASGPAPSGGTWVEVAVTVGGQRATLTGLVPSGAVPATGPSTREAP